MAVFNDLSDFFQFASNYLLMRKIKCLNKVKRIKSIR